jgi:integrase
MTENTSESRCLFTRKWIDQLPPHPRDSPSREKEYSDTQVVGLKLQVSKGGRKFFLLRYTFNKQKRAIKVGEYGPLSLNEARQRANELKAMIGRGIDPQEERRLQQQVPTFGDFVREHYLPYAYANKRTARSDESKLRIHLLPLLQHRKLDQIATTDLQRYFDQLRIKYTPATANRHLSLLSRMLKLAVTWGFLDKNPAVGIRKAQENNERHRYLSDEEIVRLLEALRGDQNPVAAAFFEFLLYTGVRKGEALAAKWEHVDLLKRVWFLPRTKNGKARHVILNPLAVELLERQDRVPGNPYLFPGKVAGQPLNNPQKCFNRALKQAGIGDFRIHDLRHTHASIAINNGASLYEVQNLLGHSQAKTTTRYAHLADETLRRVSDKVSKTILNAIG